MNGIYKVIKTVTTIYEQEVTAYDQMDALFQAVDHPSQFNSTDVPDKVTVEAVFIKNKED